MHRSPSLTQPLEPPETMRGLFVGWTARGAGLALGAGGVLLLANLFASAFNVVALVFIAVLLATAIEPLVGLCASGSRSFPAGRSSSASTWCSSLWSSCWSCSSSRSPSPRATKPSPGSRSCSSGPRRGLPSCSRSPSGRRSSPSSPPCATGSTSKRPRRTWWSKRA